ncbi:MAG: helix-turn-helix domain-containing protein [Myxococcota bacterium]
MPNPSAAFGPTLRALRHELRLSQEALAEAVGSTQRHVSFLETGRSAPTRAMLGRLVAALRLTAAQRAALFEASGFRSPYPRRQLDDAELLHTLDLLTEQVLGHWPFPGFLVDRDWRFLRSNAAGAKMIGMFGDPPDMFSLFLSPAFRGLVENWEQASGSFYTRIQEVAQRSERVRQALDRAVAEGGFAHVSRVLAGTDDVPVYVPIVVKLPDGPRMSFTSLHGRLVSVHDAVAERLEVELMVPLDEASERPLFELFQGGA